MELGDCDVYSCVPDFEGDPFADRGSMYVFFRAYHLNSLWHFPGPLFVTVRKAMYDIS